MEEGENKPGMPRDLGNPGWIKWCRWRTGRQFQHRPFSDYEKEETNSRRENQVLIYISILGKDIYKKKKKIQLALTFSFLHAIPKFGQRTQADQRQRTTHTIKIKTRDELGPPLAKKTELKLLPNVSLNLAIQREDGIYNLYQSITSKN